MREHVSKLFNHRISVSVLKAFNLIDVYRSKEEVLAIKGENKETSKRLVKVMDKSGNRDSI